MDVVTFGETMALFSTNEGKGLEFANKMDKSFGGAESNTAIGLARLGHHVGWFGNLGQDPLGLSILKTIRGEQVDVSKAKLVEGQSTGVMLRDIVRGNLSVYYYRKHSAASMMMPDDLDPEYIAQSKIMHITGITPALSTSCLEFTRKAIQIAKNNGVKVSFDPNLRLKLWNIEQARPILLELAADADYFLPGMDELKLLYGTEDHNVIFEQISHLQALTVIKSYHNQNVMIEKGRIHWLPFAKIENVIDPVGAGDGFCAGFLSGMLRGFTVEKAVNIAALIGSLVVQAAGDWEALPTWRQVEQLLDNEQPIER